jgi:acetyl esterase
MTVDIDVRTRLFTWFTDRSGVIAISRMSAEDLARARGRRLSHNVVTSRVFGPMPSDVSLTDLGVDLTATGIPGDDAVPTTLRVYRPHGPLPGGRRREDGLPIVVNYHGGGGSLGNLDQSDWLCAWVATRVGALVVSVDYRLAPEHPYPAALDDCAAALDWLATRPEVDPARVALHGMSAGGGLAAALTLRIRDLGGPAVCFQVLDAPEVDDRLDTPSMRAFVDTPLWSRPDAERSWAHYLSGPDGGANGDVPVYAAPARATDLAGLPPAYVVVYENDPLRDEGLAYASGLLAAGVGVELHLFPGTFHRSVILVGAAVSQRQAAETLEVLRRALRS